VPMLENKDIDEDVIDLDNNFLNREISSLHNESLRAIDDFRFKEALQIAMQISSKGNKYLQDTEPWKLIKTDELKVKRIMNITYQIVGLLHQTIKPLLPKTAIKINDIFRLDESADTLKINPSEILFPKIEDEQVQAQIEKLNKSKAQQSVQTIPVAETTNALQPAKPEITYDDFSKLDIRTGKIIEAEKVPKADKLLKLLVDIGIEKRTIVSGIAEHFSPEEIVGKEVSVLINLAPRKLRGIESNGMILMAEDANGKLYFVNTDGVSAGNVIK